MTYSALLSPLAHSAAVLVLATAPLQTPSPAQSSPAPDVPGVLWNDFDGDERLDALSITSEGRLRLLVNRDAAGFEDVTGSAGLGTVDSATVVLWGDYDGDRRPDLFVGRSTGASLLFHNEGTAFVDMSAGAGLVIEQPVQAAHWLDADGDGRLDLHVVTHSANQIWRGLEGGFFEPVALPLEAFGTLPGGGAGLGADPAAGDETGSVGEGSVDGAPRAKRRDRAGGFGSNGTTGGPPPPAPPGSVQTLTQISLLDCVHSMQDNNGGACIEASSAATLGMLYPLSSKFFVNEATGNVGIGTISPAYRLHINGQAVSGVGSIASGLYSTVSGGSSNTATGSRSTVSGGIDNRAYGYYATVSGGYSNNASGFIATVSGGYANNASGLWSTVSGGSFNSATTSRSTVSGGSFNSASEDFSTVSGGLGNYASGSDATVAGGQSNTASGVAAAVSGGFRNTADGLGATVPGGERNAASAIYSFAAGRRAKAMHDGAFVWGDSSDLDKPSSAVDEFNVYAEGGMRVFADGIAAPSMVVDNAGNVGMGTATPQSALHVEGIIRSSGAAGGGVASFNPQNQNASVTFSWLSDVARIRVGGRGAGATNGFDFQRIGDVSLMRLLDNGNVGIGRTPAANRLEVEGNASKTTAGSWLANSDRRIKRDVHGLDNALKWVERVRPVGFRYTEEYLAEHPGIEDIEYFNVIAQEFAEVFPDYVKRSGEGDILQVDTYPALIHALGAIQELAQRDSELTQRNDELESALGAIQERNDQLGEALAGFAKRNDELLARIEALEAD